MACSDVRLATARQPRALTTDPISVVSTNQNPAGRSSRFVATGRQDHPRLQHFRCRRRLRRRSNAAPSERSLPGSIAIYPALLLSNRSSARRPSYARNRPRRSMKNRSRVQKGFGTILDGLASHRQADLRRPRCRPAEQSRAPFRSRERTTVVWMKTFDTPCCLNPQSPFAQNAVEAGIIRSSSVQALRYRDKAPSRAALFSTGSAFEQAA